MSQPRIAAVLIVKNEGENLRACLQSVAGWVDEIVILDSGSSDNTAEIAAEFKANYQVEPHWPGYGRQRQLAQDRVRISSTRVSEGKIDRHGRILVG